MDGDKIGDDDILRLWGFIDKPDKLHKPYKPSHWTCKPTSKTIENIRIWYLNYLLYYSIRKFNNQTKWFSYILTLPFTLPPLTQATKHEKIA